jgi:hypothetical protein
MNATKERQRTHGGRLVAGVILIALGVFFLLFNLGLVEMDLPWEWWPLILVAIGAGKLIGAADHDERRGGLWMILLGAWLLINFLGLFGLGWHNSWPLLIVAAGGMMVWKSIATDEPVRRGAGEAGGEDR